MLASAFGNLFARQELPGDRLHREIPPDRWCITKNDLLDFREQVRLAIRKGLILPTERDDFDPSDTVTGPNIYTVTEQLIKPVTQDAGGMSWALMKNPKGLKCDLFVTHAWQEGTFEFIDKVISSWPMDANHAYCCMLANPQNLDISSLIRSPRESPFAQALDSAKYMLVVSNTKGSIYSRLWCVYEIYLAESWGKIVFTGRSSLRRNLLKAFGMILLSVLLGALLGLALVTMQDSAVAARELSELSSTPEPIIITQTMDVTLPPIEHLPAIMITATTEAPPSPAIVTTVGAETPGQRPMTGSAALDPALAPIKGHADNFEGLWRNGSFYVTVAMMFALGALLFSASPCAWQLCNHAVAVLCTIAALQGMKAMGIFIAELYAFMLACLCVFCILSEVDRVRDVQLQLESTNLLHDYKGSVTKAQCFSQHDAECIWQDIGSRVEEVDQAVNVLIASSVSTPLLRDAASKGVDVSGVGRVSFATAIFSWSLWLGASWIHGLGWERFSASPASRWLVWLCLLMPPIAWALSIFAVPFDFKPFAVRVVSMCFWLVPASLVMLHLLHVARVDAMVQELLGVIYFTVLGWLILALSWAGPARVARVTPCLANLYTAKGGLGCFFNLIRKGKVNEQDSDTDTSSAFSGSSSEGETTPCLCAKR